MYSNAEHHSRDLNAHSEWVFVRHCQSLSVIVGHCQSLTAERHKCTVPHTAQMSRSQRYCLWQGSGQSGRHTVFVFVLLGKYYFNFQNKVCIVVSVERVLTGPGLKQKWLTDLVPARESHSLEMFSQPTCQESRPPQPTTCPQQSSFFKIVLPILRILIGLVQYSECAVRK